MSKTYNPAELRKTFGSGYKANRPVIHFTTAPATAGYRDRIKPICGQRSRSAYGIVPDTSVVNCEKCLAATVQVPTED